MPRDLHLHPDRLGAHAGTAAELAEELHAALRGAPPDGWAPDEERVRAAVQRAVRELTALGAALAGAAAGHEAADRAVARSLGQALDGER
jgi:hypothetical protein